MEEHLANVEFLANEIETRPLTQEEIYYLPMVEEALAVSLNQIDYIHTVLETQE